MHGDTRFLCGLWGSQLRSLFLQGKNSDTLATFLQLSLLLQTFIVMNYSVSHIHVSVCHIFHMPPSIFLSFPLGYLQAFCLITTYLWVFQISFYNFWIYSTMVREHALCCSSPSKCIAAAAELSMWLAWRLSWEKLGWGAPGCLLACSAVYVSCCFVDVLPSSLSIKCRYQCLQLLLLNYSFVFNCLFFFMCFDVFLVGMPYLSNGYLSDELILLPLYFF